MLAYKSPPAVSGIGPWDGVTTQHRADVEPNPLPARRNSASENLPDTCTLKPAAQLRAQPLAATGFQPTGPPAPPGIDHKMDAYQIGLMSLANAMRCQGHSYNGPPLHLLAKPVPGRAGEAPAQGHSQPFQQAFLQHYLAQRSMGPQNTQTPTSILLQSTLGRPAQHLQQLSQVTATALAAATAAVAAAAPYNTLSHAPKGTAPAAKPAPILDTVPTISIKPSRRSKPPAPAAQQPEKCDTPFRLCMDNPKVGFHHASFIAF